MSHAHVGLITVTLSLVGAGTLKEKRSRLRPVVDGIRHRFKVSVAEVGLTNVRDRAVIAAAVVSGDVRVAESTLSHIGDAVNDYDVRVDDIATEIF